MSAGPASLWPSAFPQRFISITCASAALAARSPPRRLRLDKPPLLRPLVAAISPGQAPGIFNISGARPCQVGSLNLRDIYKPPTSRALGLFRAHAVDLRFSNFQHPPCSKRSGPVIPSTRRARSRTPDRGASPANPRNRLSRLWSHRRRRPSPPGWSIGRGLPPGPAPPVPR